MEPAELELGGGALRGVGALRQAEATGGLSNKRYLPSAGVLNR